MPEDGRPSLTEKATVVLDFGGIVFVKECELRLRPPRYLGYDIGIDYPYVSKGTMLAVVLSKNNQKNLVGVMGILLDEITPSLDGVVVVRLNVPFYQEDMVLKYATPENGWEMMEVEEFAVA